MAEGVFDFLAFYVGRLGSPTCNTNFWQRTM